MNQILKVEQKRNEAYEEFGQNDERQTLFLIDKYKFMNIYPCNQFELKSLGYKDSNNNTYLQSACASSNSGQTSSSLTGSREQTNTNGVGDEITFNSNEQFLEANLSNPFSKLASKNLSGFPAPDISKMLPFKSNKNAFSGLYPIPGGGMFLFPSIIADMIKRIPPPVNFDVSFDTIKWYIIFI